MKFICEFVGGRFNGVTLMKEKAVKLLPVTGKTEDLSEIRAMGGMVHRAELDNQPTFEGYLSPMWNGSIDGIGRLRYETQEVYDMMFD